MKKNLVAVIVVVPVLVLAASIYAAPYWTVYQMRNAIVDNDAARFSEHVDFPALRDSIKTQFVEKLSGKVDAQDARSNPLAALGSALALGLVSRIVDTMVTPAGVMLMLERAKTKPEPVTSGPAEAPAPSAATPATSPAPEQKEKPAEYALAYQDWSTVRAQAKTADADAGAFIFKRAGLWRWKLAGIALPQK